MFASNKATTAERGFGNAFMRSLFVWKEIQRYYAMRLRVFEGETSICGSAHMSIKVGSSEWRGHNLYFEGGTIPQKGFSVELAKSAS